MDKVVINQTGQVLIYEAYGFEEQAIAQLHPNALMGMIPVYVHHCVPGECNVFSLQPIRLSDVELMDAMAQVKVEIPVQDMLIVEVIDSKHVSTYSVSPKVLMEIVEGNFSKDQVKALIEEKGTDIGRRRTFPDISFHYTDDHSVEHLILQLALVLE